MKEKLKSICNFIMDNIFLFLALIAVVLELVSKKDLTAIVYALLILQSLTWILEQLRIMNRLKKLEIYKTFYQEEKQKEETDG